MMHFLLLYDAPNATLLSLEEFDDEMAALDAFTEAERKHLRDDRMRVVLLSGPSRQSIEQTHGNFFGGARDVA